MNTRNHARKALAVCLLVMLLLCQVFQTLVYASAAEPVTVSVANFTQFYTALRNAEDGDVIGVTGRFDIFANEVFGHADKRVTVRRMDAAAFIRVQSTDASFQNIIFDGNSIDGSISFLLCNGTITFQNCSFTNGLTTTANGGAVYVMGQAASFQGCSFDGNTAVQGGHMYVGGGTVTVENCTFTNGHASSDGGAIKNNTQWTASCNISASRITGNSADLFGGGISNTGYLSINTTKLFGNTAPGGGADLAHFSDSSSIDDEIDRIADLYADEGIVPVAWVNDYNSELAVEMPGMRDPSLASTLKKLQYSIPPTEIVLAESSLGVAENGAVTGLEPGKQYKVTMGSSVWYSKADGTLTTDEAESAALTESRITGLTNGETYLVEEYIPVVPEPIPDPTSEPTPEPSTEPTEPNPEPTDPTPTPTPAEDTPDPTESPSESVNQEQTSNNNNDNDNSNGSSNVNNDNDSSSTVNDNSSNSNIENNPSADASNNSTIHEGGSNASAQQKQQQSINIDLGKLLSEGQVQDDGKGNLTINVNVYVEPSEPTVQENSIIPLSYTQPIQPSAETENAGMVTVEWLELVKVCLLFGIFVCVFIRPVKR